MSAIDRFNDRHTEILDLIGDLRVMLKPEQLRVRPNAKTAYETICHLGDKMGEHLSAGDKDVYPSLLIHEDPKMKSLAWGFISGEKPLRKQFESYHRKWLKNCDFNFTEEFLAETLELFQAIEERISREQNVLLPRLSESGIFAGGASSYN